MFREETNPSKVDFHKTFTEVDHTPGAVGYGLTFGQDGNFPFPYDPVTDTYYAYRWDFLEEVEPKKWGIRPPLTKEVVNSLTHLWLTSHPYFYSSTHLKNKGRLSRVTFKKPPYLMVNCAQDLVNEPWAGNPNEPAGCVPRPITQKYIEMGYEAFYSNHRQDSPELLLVNPAKYITGVQWLELEENELREYVQVNSLSQIFNHLFNSVDENILDRAMSL